jgi:hypothetical protein
LNLVVATVAVGLTLGVAEIVLRVRARSDHHRSLTEALQGTEQPPPGADVTLGQMIRISMNPRIIYELRPQLDVFYKEARVSTNDLGFRGPMIDSDSGVEEFRIVGIGDSVMFGQAIPPDQNYLARIESELSDLHPKTKWRVVNTAVPGYNTVMEVETLRQKGLSLHPDLVIIDIVDNDLSLPNFIPAPDLRAESTLLLLWSVTRRGWNRLFDTPEVVVAQSPESDAWDPRGLIPTPATGSGASLFADRAELAPPQYSDLVGWQAFRKALSQLKGLSRKHDFELLAVTMLRQETTLRSEMLQVVQDVGIPLVDAGAAIRKYAHENELAPGLDSPLRASRNDAHPSGLAHQIAAAEILNTLRSRPSLLIPRQR